MDKYFKLKEGYLKGTIPGLLRILKTLEEFNSNKQHKKVESRGMKEIPSLKRNTIPKRENPCKLPNHQGHEWSDCFNNPHSNKFKGTAKTLKYFASMSESNIDESKE